MKRSPRKPPTTPRGRAPEGVAVVYVDPASLNPAPYNPRKISGKDFDDLKRSIASFGMVDPLIVNEHPKRRNVVVGGHQRLRVAIEAGMTSVPVVFVRLDLKRERELNLRLNKNVGEWDWEMLAEFEVPELLDAGFTDEDLAKHFDLGGEEASPDDDAIPDKVKARTKPGDVWVLGEHRLVCGDSRDPSIVESATGGRAIDLVFTSPPYNAGIKYDRHDDDMDPLEYAELVRHVIGAFYPHMRDGRAVAWNVGVTPKSRYYRHAVALEDSGMEFVRNFVWMKVGVAIPMAATHAHFVRRVLPDYTHEMVFVFSKGSLARGGPVHLNDTMHRDVIKIAASAATRDIPSVAHQRGGLLKNKVKAHPAVFPVQLPMEFVRLFTSPDEVVFDPFSGASTTMLACETLGRSFAGIELSPAYVDLSLARWENLTGRTAVLSEEA